MQRLLGISLFSVPRNVFGRPLIETTKEIKKKKIWKMQCVFIPVRECAGLIIPFQGSLSVNVTRKVYCIFMIYRKKL